MRELAGGTEENNVNNKVSLIRSPGKAMIFCTKSPLKKLYEWSDLNRTRLNTMKKKSKVMRAIRI